MNVAFLIGRIMIGMFFLMAGFNHLRNLSPMVQYAQAKGTPAPQLAVAGTGVMLLHNARAMATARFIPVEISEGRQSRNGLILTKSNKPSTMSSICSHLTGSRNRQALLSDRADSKKAHFLTLVAKT
jgi:DoxX